jgi:hypothetical protein
MGRAGRQRVAESVYNWDRKVDRVIEIYRETIGRHAPQARLPEVAPPAEPVPDEAGRPS